MKSFVQKVIQKIKSRQRAADIMLGFLFCFSWITLIAATYDYHNITGVGTRRNTLEFQVEAPDTSGTNPSRFLPGANNTNALGDASRAFSEVFTYDLHAYDDLVRVSSSVVISTDNTSGNSVGEYYTFFLASGAASADASEGSVLCATDTTTSGIPTVIVCALETDLTTWVGIAQADASTGALVNVYTSGVVLALTTMTVNPGDTLISTVGTRGYLAADTTPTTGADVGVALGAGNAAGDLTLIRLR